MIVQVCLCLDRSNRCSAAWRLDDGSPPLRANFLTDPLRYFRVQFTYVHQDWCAFMVQVKSCHHLVMWCETWHGTQVVRDAMMRNELQYPIRTLNSTTDRVLIGTMTMVAGVEPTSGWMLWQNHLN
ncbi:hypothetical protein C2845_PM13G01190 [Panicum miliaceum]|uniref:Uncharacterized protein n=1 Tax=Panicum miliaceum TaxID=4540 RepID=A0A3L6RIM4_PANMI|nr:hypothetical protein C2845_PM13G01190 [Panicum miliaceum]